MLVRVTTVESLPCPFQAGVIVSGDAYVDRPELEEKLYRLLCDGHRVVLQDDRRKGKSSLVREVARKFYSQRLIQPDLLPCLDAQGVVSQLFSAWAFYMRASSQNWVKRLKGQLADVEINLKFARVTFRGREPQQAIGTFFDLIEKEKGPVLLCLDEFQAIVSLGDADGRAILASLRGELQKRAAQPTVFTGSDRKHLAEILLTPKAPFLATLMPMALSPIPADDLRAFVHERFERGGYLLTDAAWERLVSLTRLIPGFLQELCRSVWEYASEPELGEQQIEEGLAVLLSQYTGLLTVLPRQQLRLCRAIALEQPKALLSRHFLNTYGLAAATVSGARDALQKEGYIIETPEGWRLYNPLMEEWFRGLP
jgi:hypothetical protein